MSRQQIKMGYEVLLIRATQQDYDRFDGTIKKQAKTRTPNQEVRHGNVGKTCERPAHETG